MNVVFKMIEMKNLIYTLTCFLILTSCEDVIQVDLPTENPRLIFDAVVRVDATQTSTEVRVKVTQTSSFFEEPIPVSVDQITLLNVDNPGAGGTGEPVLPEVGAGEYAKSFTTENLMQDEYLLQINVNNEIYLATTKFVPTVPIDNLEQGDGDLFGEDETELKVTFTDVEDRDDFYIFDFDFGNYLVSEDEFYQGQEFEFSYFYDEELNTGDEVEVSILGCDESFYNYIDLLIEQSEGDFGPFETPAVTVRGNFINATDIDNQDTTDNVDNPNNFALGYFAIVQEYKQTFVIE